TKEIMLKNRKNRLFFVLLSLFGISSNRAIWGFASKEFPFFSHDTHHQVTNHAIADVVQSSQFPDLQMYAQTILAGSSTEGLFGLPGSHKSIDNQTTFWHG